MAKFQTFLDYIPPELTVGEISTLEKTMLPAEPRDLNGVTISQWQDFESIIEKELGGISSEQLSSDVVKITQVPPVVCCQAEIESSLIEFVFIPVRDMMFSLLQTSCRFQPKPPGASLDPDFSWLVKSSAAVDHAIKLLIEVKTFWALDLSEKVLQRVLVSAKSNRKQTTEVDKAKQALSQIYGYMNVNHLRFGVLTNYNQTWFLRRGGEKIPGELTCQASGSSSSSSSLSKPLDYVPNSLEIALVEYSRKEPHSLMQAWIGFLMHVEANHFYSSPTNTPTIDRKPLNIKNRHRICKAGNVDIIFGEQVGRGQLGSVIKGGLRNHPAADKSLIKLVDRSKSSELAAKLEHEVEAYRALEDLQGTIIPEIIGYVDINGWMRGLIIMNCGEDCSKFGFTASQKKKLSVMMKEIHSRGVAHGDISGCNIVRDERGALKIIDFSEAKFKGSVSEQEFRKLCDEDLAAIAELPSQSKKRKLRK